ncbi:MAG: histidine kinase, partial [Bacillota bacterium]|nr:histidine kinase [Bacillota bacterium]
SFNLLIDAVAIGNVASVREQVKNALKNGIKPMDIIDNGLMRAMNNVGWRFERNEIYVTELLVSARAVHGGLEEIRPYLLERDIPFRGRVVIGTVAGDLHDIGKNILSMVLQARGYEVIDLGVDVAASSFVDAVAQQRPDVLCLSALLTTTVHAMEETIHAIDDARLRSGLHIVVGGAAVTENLASAMGADGYGETAYKGVKIINEMLEFHKKIQGNNLITSVLAGDAVREWQDSFRDFSGLSLVLVDKEGLPVSNAGGFFDCTGRCAELSGILDDKPLDIPLQDITADSEYQVAFAYRCRCGLMEISYPLIGENGQIGAMLCGHFLLEEDMRFIDRDDLDIPVLSKERCEGLCNFLAIIGRKIVDLIDNTLGRQHLEGQQETFVNFMKKQHMLEEKLKEAELSALQNQVNPHFLFNSLNTIARVAAVEGDKYTESLVSALARLMRYSLYQVRSIVTLEEEVKTVRDYLKIQEARFRDRMSHRIDVESSILNAKMPCMILQPLVENACQHGLEPCRRGGIVSIQGWIENKQVFLEVSDNGAGMSEELQKNIFKLEDIQSTKGGQVSGLGLNNVLSRLQHHFGSDCAWDISSAINKGTTLQLSFPYVV